MIQPQNPRSKQPQPGRVRQGPGDADGPLEAVPGLEDGVVGPLLAGGDDLGEEGSGPSRESLNQAVQNLQKHQKQALAR